MEPSTQNLEVLYSMFNRIRPNARYRSQLHIEDETRNIQKQIISGVMNIAQEQANVIQLSQMIKNREDTYEEHKKKHHMQQIEREKQLLESKLQYITQSINSMSKPMSLSKSEERPNISSQQLRLRNEVWRKEIKLREQKINSLKKQQQHKEVQKQQQRKQTEVKMKQIEVEKKRRQIQDKLQKIKKRKMQRESSVRSQNHKVREILDKQELHHKLQQNYQDQEESILEERKKKLAQIRQLYKPINQQELQRHQQKIVHIQKEKEEIREKERKMNQTRAKTYKAPYVSQFYKQVAQHDNQGEEANLPHAKAEKMKQFADMVKTKFTPEIDQTKRNYFLQMEQKQQQMLKKKQQQQEELAQKSKMMGMQYLEEVHKLPKKKSESKVVQTQRKTYHNYLNRSTHTKNKPWTQILKQKGSTADKALLLQFQSQKVEEELKRKQMQTKILNKKDTGEIDEGYYDMIKAKLDLLEQNSNT